MVDIRIGNIISYFVKFFYNVYVKIQFKKEYQLEKKCLKRIEKNYICSCENNCNHFPKIIYFNDYFNLLIITDSGTDLKYLNKPITIENFEQQLNCILKNFERSKINQNDIVPKNICINDKGILSIIDFDLATIDNFSNNDLIYLKKNIIKHVNKNNYLILKSNLNLMLKINCISLQSKRNQRFLKISPYYKNLNLIEKKAIEGTNKSYIDNLKKELNIRFDYLASYGNQALFLKAYLLWQDFYKNSNDDYMIIIEDDVVPIKNINYEFNKIHSELPTDFDICLLMGINTGLLIDYNENLYSKAKFTCIGAYMISKKGAKVLMDLAVSEIVKTHSSGAVMDYWVNYQMHKLKYYKTKKDLFNILNIPSSLATSRNKFVEKFFFILDRKLVNNYLFYQHIEIREDSIIPFQVNGKISITSYVFFNLFLKYLFYLLIGNKLSSFIITATILGLDIGFNIYLLEEIINKSLEYLIALFIFYFF